MKIILISCSIVLFALQSVGFADLIVDVGNHTLAPNTAMQRISITIFSNDAVNDSAISGMELHVELGDGPGGQAEPTFDAIDYTGGVFGSNTPSGGVVDGFPMLIDAGILSGANITPDANSRILVELFVDTTGINATTSEQMFGVSIFGHDTVGLPATQLLGPLGNNSPLTGGVSLRNGSVRIAAVPEPSSLGLIALAAPMILRRKRVC